MANQAATTDPAQLNRRQLLGLGVSGGSSLLLGGCALNGLSETVGNATQPLNERIEVIGVRNS